MSVSHVSGSSNAAAQVAQAGAALASGVKAGGGKDADGDHDGTKAVAATPAPVGNPGASSTVVRYA